MAYGQVLAQDEADVIALQDCDVVTYDRGMLARLVYPLVSPNLDLKFCKAYYARVTDRLHGRVTRLLISPLIRSMMRLVGYHEFLRYLDSFRYPLAGEFAMKAELTRVMRVPNDWGLEVGLLAEVYRNTAIKRVCQVDIANQYEHKHQGLSQEDPEKGLMRMSVDICKTLFRTMAAEGIELSRGILTSLLATYVRTAEDTLIRYHADAVVNGLSFDRHEEEVAVDSFSRAVKIAGEQFTEDPLGMPQLPNWARIHSALPEFFNKLTQAVEADNAGISARAVR
jgi:glucosyl-3-phosphoglycerate synthase